MKQAGNIIYHAVFLAWVVENGRIQENFLEWSALMRRRCATTELVFEALRMLQEAVGVLSEPECGASMLALGNALGRVAYCITRAASSRSELVILPYGLVDETNSEVTSAGQGFRQAIL